MARILINLIVLHTLIYDVNGKLSNKLVGGSHVLIDNYPFQVSVRIHDDHHLCGGSIITPLHILTSASCVTSHNNIVYGNLKVSSGTGDGDNRNNHGTLSDVAFVIIHYKYSPSNFWANDLSVLKLTKSLIIAPYCKPIDWPKISQFTNYKFQLIGWILLGENRIRLSKFPITFLSSSECNKQFILSGGIRKGQSCIKTNSASHQIVNGDGGNPVVTTRSKKLIGVISLVSTEPDCPSIVTQVEKYYHDWLLRIINRY